MVSIFLGGVPGHQCLKNTAATKHDDTVGTRWTNINQIACFAQRALEGLEVDEEDPEQRRNFPDICPGADLRAENAPKRLDDDVPVDPRKKLADLTCFALADPDRSSIP